MLYKCCKCLEGGSKEQLLLGIGSGGVQQRQDSSPTTLPPLLEFSLSLYRDQNFPRRSSHLWEKWLLQPLPSCSS